ncbi:MAG TPA: hypothetical protein VL769_10260 [Acidimicrobiia bacterium]|nr:hypothetical protein [Acidimicrobiia bacterium]
MLPDLPAAFAPTRDALHALAEQVVSAAYYHATKHIGLRPTPRGLGTPVFHDHERVRVDGTALVHELAGSERRAEITTLREAAAFVGVPLGAPDVYKPATAVDPDSPLAIDHDSVLALGDWYALGHALLQDLRTEHSELPSTESQLWPEHFDLACEIGSADTGTRANFGASPGDIVIPEPYLYVGPWETKRKRGMLARYPFGGALTYDEMRRAGEAGAAGRQFFEDAIALLSD